MTRKTLVIAVREFQAAIRTKTFFISLVIMPVFMFGSIAVQMLLHDKVDVGDKSILVVDYTDRVGKTLLAEAEKRNAEGIFQGEGETRKQVRPRFMLTVEQPGAGMDADQVAGQTLALSDRVRAGEFFAFVIIRADALSPGAPKPDFATIEDSPPDAAAQNQTSVAYHSRNPTYDDVRQWMRPVLTRAIHEARLGDLQIDSARVLQALAPVSIDNLGLVTRDAEGHIRPAEKTNELASFFVPFGMLMLMFMVVMITTQPLLQSVLEEKMQRIVEVLVACASPFEIMLGKLLGMLGVSLVIVCVYFLGALYALDRTGYASLFPTHLLGWFIVFQCLAVLMYGSMFISVGAAVNDLKEAQNLVTPMMLIIIAPFFVWLNIVKEPTTTFAAVASLFPPATPMLMLVRLAVPPGIPMWQPLLGVLLVLATTVGCVFAAGRVFRIGLLTQGKAPKFAELIGWIIRG